jgi:hypothetical protein
MFARQSIANFGHLERMSIKPTITTELVKAARMLLGWGQGDLAEKSGVSWSRIKHLEAKPGPLRAYPSTIAAIRKALEYEGIRFFGGDAPGVRLYKTTDESGARIRKFAPAVAVPGRRSKPVKTVKAVVKKRR